MFVKVTNGQAEEYTIGQLRRDNPKTSFPKQIPNELLAEFDVYPVYNQETGIYDSLTQKVEEGNFIQDENGTWLKEQTVVDLDEASASANVREKRDGFLAEVDLDMTILAEKAYYDPTRLKLDSKFVSLRTYKQRLRDLPEQEGFPFTVDWPTKPE